jgi:hypothetical protein
MRATSRPTSDLHARNTTAARITTAIAVILSEDSAGL